MLAGVADAANNAGGLRLARTNAQLQVQMLVPAPPVATNPPVITRIELQPDHSVTVDFLGRPGVSYRVQATTTLTLPSWLNVSTNLASTNGTWSFNDVAPTNLARRFYRAITP